LTYQVTSGTDKQASFPIIVSFDFSMISGLIMMVSLANSCHFFVSFREVTAIILIFFQICGAASQTQSFSYIKSIMSFHKLIKSSSIFVIFSDFVLKIGLFVQVCIV
jgi:hypothetical protein